MGTTARHHAHYHRTGSGHLYQGRFKSFSVQSDGHFFVLRRYVERNALAAGLVSNAEQWLFGSHVIGLAEVVELRWRVSHRQGCPIG